MIIQNPWYCQVFGARHTFVIKLQFFFSFFVNLWGLNFDFRKSGGREGRTSEIKLGSIGVQVFRIIRVKAKPVKLPICIKPKLWSHATSVHQSTMAAERIIVQELGQLNPTSTIL